jgi:hypothetical protein
MSFSQQYSINFTSFQLQFSVFYVTSVLDSEVCALFRLTICPWLCGLDEEVLENANQGCSHLSMIVEICLGFLELLFR